MFETNPLYNIICENNTEQFKKYVSRHKEISLYRTLSRNGETYLHLAVEHRCHLDIIKELIPRVRLGQRNVSAKTAYELSNEIKDGNTYIISQFHQDFILDCIKDGKYCVLEELVLDGWAYWPFKGTPEVEQFIEAPIYLSGIFGNLSYHGLPNLISRKNLAELVKKASATQAVELTKRRDVLGMSILHLAILYRDFEAVSGLLKWPEMLEVQDNMGRIPLHYACSMNEESEIRIEVEMACKERQTLYKIVDKTAHTSLDYSEKKATIEIKKVANLYTHLIKTVELHNFTDSVIEGYKYTSTFFPDRGDDTNITMMAFNTQGEPLIDSSGRNILHKVVICLFNNQAKDKIRYMLDLDTECKLFKGQDLWGRTPLHYAYMLNINNVDILLTKRAYISQMIIDEVKAIKDFDGKTADEYRGEEAEYIHLKRKLIKTFRLLSIVGLITLGQEVLMKELLKKQLDNYWSDNDDDAGEKYELYKDISWNVLEEYDISIKMLCIYAKTVTGVPLLHYIVALDNMKMAFMFEDFRQITTIEDNMGRNILHYLAGIPKEMRLKHRIKDILDENELECSGSNVKDYSMFSSDDEESNDGNYSNEDERDSSEENVIKHKIQNSVALSKRKNVSPVMRFDLYSMKPSDYEGKHPDFSNKRLVEKTLSACLQVPIITVVEDQSYTNKYKQNELSCDNNVNKHHTFKTARQRCFAEKRPSVKFESESGLSLDSEYLKKAVGVILTGGLSVISLIQPADPIEYLAHYLYKYSDDLKYQKAIEDEQNQLSSQQQEAKLNRNNREVIKMEQYSEAAAN